MNNGRYLTIMDLGRLDMVLRSGIWRAIRANGWSPMLGSAVIRFRRELRPFARYRLETRIVGWTDTISIVEQTFVIVSGAHRGTVAARALVKAGFYDRRSRSFVPVVKLIQALGVSAEEAVSPPLTPEVEAFLAADRSLRPINRSGDPAQ
jgi:acyl-CoA thioesterase FadM